MASKPKRRVRHHVNPLSFRRPVEIPDWSEVFAHPERPLEVDVAAARRQVPDPQVMPLVNGDGHLPPSRHVGFFDPATVADETFQMKTPSPRGTRCSRMSTSGVSVCEMALPSVDAACVV